jgi:hypothetical protein
MTAVLVTLLHLVVTAAKLSGPDQVRAVIAENLLLRQQLIVLRRPRQRAPNLTSTERVLCELGSIFLRPGRIHKVAIGVRPSTLLAFHQALARRKYRRLFSSSRRPKKPGPKGPSDARKLADFTTYYNGSRSHASLAGNTLPGIAAGQQPVYSAELDHVRGLTLSRAGPAPDGGLTTNSRPTRSRWCHIR